MTVILIQNASLLVTLSFLYAIIRWYRPKSELFFQAISGLWFGLSAIASMMLPVEYIDGILIDGRTVVLTLAGLFGGWLPSIISVAVAELYRFHVGGVGQWIGSGMIVSSAVAGLVFRRVYRGKLTEINLTGLLGIGITSHLVMLSLLLLLPTSSISMFSTVSPSIMIVLPVAFVVVSRLLQLTDRFIGKNQEIKEAGELYRTTLLSIGDAVICTDEDGRITQMNKVAQELTGWEIGDAKGMRLENVFRIINETTREEVESPFTKVMSEGTVVGLANHTLLIAKDGHEIPIADSGAPIFSKNKTVGVVLVFRDQSEEKEHQEKLRESEARFKALHNASFGGISIHDKGLILDCNKGLSTLTGYAYDELVGMDGLLLIAEETREMVLSNILTGYEKPYEAMGVRKNGEKYPMRLEGRQIPYKGKTVRVVEFRDITERKIAEQELLANQRFLAKSQEIAQIGGWGIDLATWNITWTEEQYNIYGVKVNTPVDYDLFLGCLHPDDTEYVDAAWRKGIENASYDIEHRLIVNGEVKWVREKCEFTFDADGKTAQANGVTQDITDRKNTEFELVKAKRKAEESERHLEAALENMAEGVFITDATGVILNSNSSYVRFCKFKSRTEMIRKFEEYPGLFDVFFLSGEKALPEQWAVPRALRGETAINQLYVISRKNDNQSWIGSYNFAPIKNHSNEITGCVVTVSDVSDEIKLKNDLITAKEKAEESDKLKSAFLANMSHEIRTPLNGIVGFANLLIENDLADPDRQNYIRIVNESSENLLKIIGDILDISKLDSGNPVIEKKPCDVNKILSSVDFIFRRKLENTGNENIKLIMKPAPGKLILVVDQTRLTQIFSNLLDNAIRFTPHGSVSFGISRTEPHLVEFFVADTGIGIPPENQQMIFERFTQADMGLRRSYGGVGLGLAIVKKLVGLMGGEIILRSEAGRGSRFFFNIPTNGIEIKHIINEKSESSTQPF
jgi:PAS domain S-box-containing protein